MTIRLYDTMRRAKVDFVPHDASRVTMYVCGPTVYNRAHIGNARPAVVFDVLARLLRHDYGAENVVYARNITDIDDKIMAAANERGVEIHEIAAEFEAHYLADMGALGVARPDIEPHATQFIAEMIAMITKLIEKGAAYAVQGHEVLFDVESADYPTLTGQRIEEKRAGTRAKTLAYKRNGADFVLWKPSEPGEPGWDSPWGYGRPGWHIECSAMIAARLGTTIDIHGGGLDLIFPHHENEIAQSTCAHDGAPLARYWLHNGFLSMGTEKMSKSLGNVALVSDLLAEGWHGEVLRLALLTAHYRQPLEWTVELLRESESRLERLYRKKAGAIAEKRQPDHEFVDHLNDDLNTPRAIARLSDLARFDNEELVASANFIGLLNENPEAFFQRGKYTTSPTSGRLKGGVSHLVKEMTLTEQVIKTQIAARTAARARRDFAESDRIRDELAASGIILEDGPAGTTWRRA